MLRARNNSALISEGLVPPPQPQQQHPAGGAATAGKDADARGAAVRRDGDKDSDDDLYYGGSCGRAGLSAAAEAVVPCEVTLVLSATAAVEAAGQQRLSSAQAAAATAGGGKAAVDASIAVRRRIRRDGTTETLVCREPSRCGLMADVESDADTALLLGGTTSGRNGRGDDNGDATSCVRDVEDTAAAFNAATAAAASAAAAARGTAAGAASRGCWSAVTQAQLRSIMAEYGVHTDAVDRFVVSQQRLAVDAGDPVNLLHQVEALVGTAGYGERIAAAEADMARLSGQADGEEQEAQR